ncbi:MAG: hypothetical protein K8823_1528 [Cenarchaeum symbiont of Oopsacas minuta]|nr:hypothetical protein [Cenarchaeum symbiont of Oopsacas minuta]
MNHKYNQWLNKNITHDDTSERNEIVYHLRKKSEYADSIIANNEYIQIDMTDGKIYGSYKTMPTKKPNCRTYRPDISIWNSNNELLYVVEIDGNAHKKGGESNRTTRRNQDYADSDITCLIIDRDDCDKAWKISYTERLEQLLLEFGK